MKMYSMETDGTFFAWSISP